MSCWWRCLTDAAVVESPRERCPPRMEGEYEAEDVARLGLAALLERPACRSAFREFLRSEFSVENLSFWEAAEAFAEDRRRLDSEVGTFSERCRVPIAVLPPPGFALSLPLREGAREIVRRFLGDDSPEAVSMGAARRQALLAAFESSSLADFSRELRAAADETFHLMEYDSFPRFCVSEASCAAALATNR